MKKITFAMYKRTYNTDGSMKNDELLGNTNEFTQAVAIVALMAHNANNECVIKDSQIPEDSYKYLVYEMNENGDIDLSIPLYQTEMYFNYF